MSSSSSESAGEIQGMVTPQPWVTQGESGNGGSEDVQDNFAVNPVNASTLHPVTSSTPFTSLHSIAHRDRAPDPAFLPETGGSPSELPNLTYGMPIGVRMLKNGTPTNSRANPEASLSTHTPGYSTEAVASVTKREESSPSSFYPQQASPDESVEPSVATSSSALAEDQLPEGINFRSTRAVQHVAVCSLESSALSRPSLTSTDVIDIAQWANWQMVRGTPDEILDHAEALSSIMGRLVEPIWLDGMNRALQREWTLVKHMCGRADVVEQKGVRFITLGGTDTIEMVEEKLAMCAAMSRADARLEATGGCPPPLNAHGAFRVAAIAVLTGTLDFDGSENSSHFLWMGFLRSEMLETSGSYDGTLLGFIHQDLAQTFAQVPREQMETPRLGVARAFSQPDVTSNLQSAPVAAAAVVTTRIQPPETVQEHPSVGINTSVTRKALEQHGKMAITCQQLEGNTLTRTQPELTSEDWSNLLAQTTALDVRWGKIGKRGTATLMMQSCMDSGLPATTVDGIYARMLLDVAEEEVRTLRQWQVTSDEEHAQVLQANMMARDNEEARVRAVSDAKYARHLHQQAIHHQTIHHPPPPAVGIPWQTGSDSRQRSARLESAKPQEVKLSNQFAPLSSHNFPPLPSNAPPLPPTPHPHGKQLAHASYTREPYLGDDLMVAAAMQRDELDDAVEGGLAESDTDVKQLRLAVKLVQDQQPSSSGKAPTGSTAAPPPIAPPSATTPTGASGARTAHARPSGATATGAAPPQQKAAPPNTEAQQPREHTSATSSEGTATSLGLFGLHTANITENGEAYTKAMISKGQGKPTDIKQEVAGILARLPISVVNRRIMHHGGAFANGLATKLPRELGGFTKEPCALCECVHKEVPRRVAPEVAMAGGISGTYTMYYLTGVEWTAHDVAVCAKCTSAKCKYGERPHLRQAAILPRKENLRARYRR